MLIENTPTLYTQRLILRKFRVTDEQALFALLSDAQVNTFLPWFPLRSSDEARTFMQERFLSYYDKPAAYRYAICLQKEDVPIGYVWLADNESYDFGYALRKEYWHQGIVSEAAEAVVARIRSARYSYITATHDVNNPHSGDVMRKLDMQYRYTYVEQWQPKEIPVHFRMYQLRFDGDPTWEYDHYLRQYPTHYRENI